MLETLNEWLGAAAPWWPAIAKICVLWFLGQFFKKRFWTKAFAATHWFGKLMRKTLPLHPFAAAIVWGLAWPWLPGSASVASQGGAVTEGLICAFIIVVGHTALEFIGDYHVKRNPDSKWSIVLRILRDGVSARETVPPPGKQV